MKLSLIAAMLMLCSCAVGVSDPIESSIDAGPTMAPVQKAPPPEADVSDAAPPIKCTVDAYWEGNCFIVVTICKGKPNRVDVSCGPTRPLWPWEVIPDPPYDSRKPDNVF